MIEKDFSEIERRDFTINKKILWESGSATNKEVNKMEVKLIRQFKSNNPDIGYNQWSKNIRN